MPFVNVRIVKQVIAADPDGRKASRPVAAAEGAGVPGDAVWVVLHEVPARDRHGGRQSVQELRAAQP
jgi:4-oxalocrotonate tautomerase